MVVMLDNTPFVVEHLHSSGTAQTRHKLHARLRNLKSGHVIDRVFAENERVPLAHLQTRRVTYSFRREEMSIFLDADSFEELDLSDELLGDRRLFLKENEEYKALLLDGRLLDIVLPAQVPLKVADTGPPIRGGADSAWKEAKLETGIQIMVPLFIAKGDTVRVDTAERKYVGKQTA